MYQRLLSAISDQLGTVFQSESIRPESGGQINQSFSVHDGAVRYFIKTSSLANAAQMFAAEAAGLEDIRRSNSLRVPEVLATGEFEKGGYLCLEHLPLQRLSNAKTFGENLAVLHNHHAREFGWSTDNWIGTTPQCNSPTARWDEFWIRCRLTPQIELAQFNGMDEQTLEQLMSVRSATPEILEGHNPPAALLHGDLWMGNVASLATDQSVVFDPAVYYGDAETDLAMLTLFGSPPEDFWPAYRHTHPAKPGFEQRQALYQLYHLINHFNLFGSGYTQSVQAVCRRILLHR